MFPALPPDVRKGFAFPATLEEIRGYASFARGIASPKSTRTVGPV